MAMAALSPLQTQINAIFNQLLAQIGMDLLQNGSGLLTTYFTNIQANSDPVNIANQTALLLVAIPLQLPNLESAVMKQVATAGLQIIQLLLHPPTA